MYHYLSLSYVYTHTHSYSSANRWSLLISDAKKKKDFGPREIKELRLKMVHALQSMPFCFIPVIILDLLLEARIEEIRYFISYSKST